MRGSAVRETTAARGERASRRRRRRCRRCGLSWESARRVAASAAGPLPVAEVPLRLAYGRRLARPLHALVPVPGADVAAMDGYAVAGDPPWRVVGLVLAGGAAFGAALVPGAAVEIATGAPVPEGAGAVLPYEAAVRVISPAAGRAKVVSGVIEPGRHIRRRGEDCPQGAVVLTAGSVVTPAVLGLAAGLGHDTLPVRARPVVSVLVTGDEVVTRGLPGPGRVRDAIGPMLPGLIEWAGGRAEEPLWLPDGASALAAALWGLGGRRRPAGRGGRGVRSLLEGARGPPEGGARRARRGDPRRRRRGAARAPAASRQAPRRASGRRASRKSLRGAGRRADAARARAQDALGRAGDPRRVGPRWLCRQGRTRPLRRPRRMGRTRRLRRSRRR